MASATSRGEHPGVMLRCPGCHAGRCWDGTLARCPKCGTGAVLWRGLVPDFLEQGDGRAESILEWPDDVLTRADCALKDAEAGLSTSADDRKELAAWGLIELDGRLTDLGHKIAYHLSEERRQSSDDFLSSQMLSSLGISAASCVLDVGCGAGQSLRRLISAGRVGVDRDLEALALGCRLSAATGDDLLFVRASAHALPFADGCFTHVLSRVALNYMHQRTALGEMARVLRPGGTLYCRVEGPGHDLRRLRRAQGLGHLLNCLHDLGAGLVLEFTGRQATPGSRFNGGRAFATLRRIRIVLRRFNCDVTASEATMPFGGLPRGIEVLALKR